MSAFSSVSVVLPVRDETYSLIQIIDIIDRECGDDVGQYLIVVSSKTSVRSLEIARACVQRFGVKVKIHLQKLPFLGGAIREAFQIVPGSHILIMSCELETDPHQVKNFIREAKNNPQAIIAATRWKKGGDFIGYSNTKLVFNWVLQKILSLMYCSKLTDFTYGFRLYPVSLVKRIKWEEIKRPILIETLLKPLKLGVVVIEIPSVWFVRTEGKSEKCFWKDFGYFITGLRILTYSSKKILIEK